MIVSIVIIVFLIGILFSKLIYNSYLNPITIYGLIWVNMIIWFEMRLIEYDQLSNFTYFIIIAVYLFFLLGSIVGHLYSGKVEQKIGVENNWKLNSRFIKTIIIVSGLIGFASAILNWSQLFSLYGSLPNIFLNGPEIYGKRVDGEITEVIPYINSFIYVSIFFSALLYARTLKFSLIFILPFIALFLKEIAAFGRSGILFGLFEFGIVFISVRLFVINRNIVSQKMIIPMKGILTATFVLLLAVLTATTVKSFRASVENFRGSSRELNAFKGNIVLSPSIYYYMSSHLGVLNKYFEKDIEKAEFGENSLLIIHSILSKMGLVERPSDYQKGYLFPTWSNTGTYIREIHSDFGIIGTIIIPFLLGFGCIITWKKWINNGDLIELIFFVFFSLIVANSFLVMATRLTYFVIAFFILTVTASLLKSYLYEK